MPFQTPLSIKEVIYSIEKKEYLLPGIQREFVWGSERICRLFDSIMQGFPIGSFLFWKVEKDKINDFQFYEFLRNYHERNNRHNPKADVSGYKDLIAILDGQQRLTSLYIGLKGTYSYKLPRKFKDNSSAYPERQLYLNLLDESKNEDLKYDFRFLTKSEAEQRGESIFWFRVGEILDLDEEYKVNDYLINNVIFSANKDASLFANRTLFKLHSVVHKERIINYFLEKDQSLDKVLNIFIRVNSAGLPLSYADMLLSIATASWEKMDAKEEFNNFIDDINDIRFGFRFDRDFILKSCLVLCGFKNIAFKVDNFDKETMKIIEKNWENIKSAIRNAVGLVADFGFHSKTLVANYAVIPIAYYLYKGKLGDAFRDSVKYKSDRKKLQRWILLSIANQVFGGHPDEVIRQIRSIIDANGPAFPLEDIINKFKGTNKALDLDEEEIENFFLNKYGQQYTFSILSLLYPHLDYRNQFHIDHIFPRSQFSRRNLLKRGIKAEDVDFYMENYDRLANLQILEGPENKHKKDLDFDKWLSNEFDYKEEAKQEFMRINYIPENIDLSINNFKEFIKERKQLMKDKYKKILLED